MRSESTDNVREFEVLKADFQAREEETVSLVVPVAVLRKMHPEVVYQGGRVSMRATEANLGALRHSPPLGVPLLIEALGERAPAHAGDHWERAVEHAASADSDWDDDHRLEDGDLAVEAKLLPAVLTFPLTAAQWGDVAGVPYREREGGAPFWWFLVLQLADVLGRTM